MRAASASPSPRRRWASRSASAISTVLSRSAWARMVSDCSSPSARSLAASCLRWARMRSYTSLITWLSVGRSTCLMRRSIICMPRPATASLIPFSCSAISSLRSPETSCCRVRELIWLRSESVMIGARRALAMRGSPPVARK
ncbi:hypothetical protein D3C81_1710780 [compost metagenome]